MSVYPFPNASARALIHTIIQLHAAGKWTRQQMMDQIHYVMGQYKCKKIKIHDYTVRISSPVATSIGVFNTVIIEANKISDNIGCPACHGTEAGYLNGDRAITAMCRDCGCIYQFKARKEELL